MGVNIRFLIEGEEEVSGESLPTYLAQNAARLKSDYTLIWDGGFSPDDDPALATGLRGMVYTEVHVQGPAVDLHSGMYGGVAPNPNNTLAHIIADLKDRDGHITIPGYYEGVQTPDPEETVDWNRSPEFTQQLPKLTGARALEGEPQFPPVERTSQRPTLDVNGMIGGFTGEGSKTVIPARAMAKISMRLVPDQDPDEVFAAFEEHVKSLATPGTTVEVKRLGSAKPVLSTTRAAPRRRCRPRSRPPSGSGRSWSDRAGRCRSRCPSPSTWAASWWPAASPRPAPVPTAPTSTSGSRDLPRGIATLLRFLYTLS